MQVLSSVGVRAHQYADDTQAYVQSPASDATSLVEKMLLTSEVNWRLDVIQPSSAEPWKNAVHLGWDSRAAIQNQFFLSTASLSWRPFSTTVRDLGVTLDQELTFSEHVRNVCRTCFYHLCQIRSKHRSLTTKAATTLMHQSRLWQCYLCGLNPIVH